jgi:hypothetical protein
MITEEEIKAVRTFCMEALQMLTGEIGYVNISYSHINTILNLVKEHKNRVQYNENTLAILGELKSIIEDIKKL